MIGLQPNATRETGLQSRPRMAQVGLQFKGDNARYFRDKQFRVRVRHRQVGYIFRPGGSAKPNGMCEAEGSFRP